MLSLIYIYICIYIYIYICVCVLLLHPNPLYPILTACGRCIIYVLFYGTRNETVFFSYCTRSYRIIAYHSTTCHTMSYHVVSYHIISHHEHVIAIRLKSVLFSNFSRGQLWACIEQKQPRAAHCCSRTLDQRSQSLKSRLSEEDIYQGQRQCIDRRSSSCKCMTTCIYRHMCISIQ